MSQELDTAQRMRRCITRALREHGGMTDGRASELAAAVYHEVHADMSGQEIYLPQQRLDRGAAEVKRANEAGEPVSKTIARLHISRATYYRWLNKAG